MGKGLIRATREVQGGEEWDIQNPGPYQRVTLNQERNLCVRRFPYL